VFTYELARRLEGTGVTANCVHPGVIHTGLLRNFSFVLNALFGAFGRFFKSADEGADTPVYLACSPEVSDVSGKYFKYRRPLGSSEESNDPEVQRRLWEVSEALTGIASPI
jgi:NAD(P)-dependent dehydrogenase (short-subunit alcohol dehydrogenase family)